VRQRYREKQSRRAANISLPWLPITLVINRYSIKSIKSSINSLLSIIYSS
jgi:hypothetical protein